MQTEREQKIANGLSLGSTYLGSAVAFLESGINCIRNEWLLSGSRLSLVLVLFALCLLRFCKIVIL